MRANKIRSIRYWMCVIFVVLAGLILATIWTPGSEEKRVLEDNGLTNIQLDTLSLWGCPGNQYGYDFSAINPQNKSVKGVMCKSHLFLGSWTVRYY